MLDNQTIHQKNSEHYDAVVQSWQILMGENFHWGYFNVPGMSLDDATIALIDLLAGFLNLHSTHRVLDIGCGIGEPAMHLHQKYGCQVVGISNSPKGIKTANEIAEQRGLDSSVTFQLRDALRNGFEDNSFDATWLMEMSHLIQDKEALIHEAARCVKPNGQIALCDLTFNRRPLPRDIFANLENHKVLKRAFGEAQLETLEVYQSLFEDAGLTDIEILDISSEVKPTLQHWKSNALHFLEDLKEPSQRTSLEDFAKSCDILDVFYGDGTWGYGCVVGRKPH